MPHYFFDIHDGRIERDEHGAVYVDLQAAARKAKRLLPAIARDKIPKDGERQSLMVGVTDEDGQAVY